MVLSNLHQGQTAVIQDLSCLNPIVRRRLGDLGFRIGSEIQIKSAMPFGGPCVIESNGQHVGIRLHEASCIRVERP
ncbi:FeoA family protein [Oceanobacillus halophilus]|uniref:Ferrous iron transport protein A n=1 Tax=Oceanobacillus halophilus TaxID=930130 RepID=A0A494ZWK8_9BACI|nr:FeoA family protein [Oceanobacillus halophilus]RKQ30274.1 ferrous iron transport protein A [Oceanobacillus halophilus]